MTQSLPCRAGTSSTPVGGLATVAGIERKDNWNLAAGRVSARTERVTTASATNAQRTHALRKHRAGRARGNRQSHEVSVR